ncbi:UBP-type zinc finger domain-containing protein [Amycolatopsis sp. FDAARGOS 1241]|uniref:UBP-type zinc finger domain-containing protein n=1 Tax=Amycolatopsis sp. FDAARGOS 1241 TaxID=2778070 RepID=UPI0019513F1C|nr:UBP-type zinc finger domain-containing protein [Amycolatopsis sp. FDAARGOS 1241]QRP47798.1 UBP-type zinc finger domain-containing protein [Amycolatopsis sp. FDAARGOS 1241]
MEGVDPAVPPSGTGCAECDAATPQGWWFHLRRCAQCGHVGCCDSSPGQHASAHAASSGHRLVRSFEPGEEWFWDYAEEVMYERGPDLAPPVHHPLTQSAPGPADRLPLDWAQKLHQ